ncbi:hypothetical protein K501DRAFT_285729 [Backusella circina FSU 941]|nr:hypothetical protein K501DRAFT_285729 [Backusella circina FSU 941]
MSILAAVSQVTRPNLIAVSKRTVRAYLATTTTTTTIEEPTQMPEDKVHHQVAPLTDATLYSPQGTTEVNPTFFSPIVNAVFDE